MNACSKSVVQFSMRCSKRGAVQLEYGSGDVWPVDVCCLIVCSHMHERVRICTSVFLCAGDVARRREALAARRTPTYSIPHFNSALTYIFYPAETPENFISDLSVQMCAVLAFH